MPALHLTAGKPVSKRPAPKRPSKPAAKRPAGRTAPAKKTPARKPAARKPAPVEANGARTQGPKLPEGWTEKEFAALLKQMDEALSNKQAAEEALKDASTAVNVLALESINWGVQMSVVVDNLHLSRQWLYTIMENAGTMFKDYGFTGPVLTARQMDNPHPNKGLTQDEIDAKAARKAKAAAKKPAAKKSAARSAAKKPPARKPAASARKPPARKAPARRGSGTIRLAA